MDATRLASGYLDSSSFMQLATVQGGKPWICTVAFVHDGFDLYWLSYPTRRHSQDIAVNPHVAVAIAVKTDFPVIGMQFEGKADTVQDPELISRIMRPYAEKFSIGGEFYDNFIAGKNKHWLYRFTPDRGQLFDEVNFPGGEGQEIEISGNPKIRS